MTNEEYQWADTSSVIELANALAWRAATTVWFAMFGLYMLIAVLLLQAMPETFDWLGGVGFATFVGAAVYGLIYWVKGISVVNLMAPFLVPDNRPRPEEDTAFDEDRDDDDDETDSPLADFEDRGDGLLVKRGSQSATNMNPPHPINNMPTRTGLSRVPGIRRVVEHNGGGGGVVVDEAEELDF